MKSHLMSRTKLYERWCSIKKRCYNPNCKSYKSYGQRGITMCEEWKNDFMSFYNWAVHNGYSPELSIDRIDNNKGYSPENCRFTTAKVQGRNKSNNCIITYKGMSKPLSEWCDIFSLTYNTVQCRLQHGWTIEESFEIVPHTTSFDKHTDCGKFKETTNITINNETKSLKEWCVIYNAPYNLVWKRYYMRNWDIIEALTTPSKRLKL